MGRGRELGRLVLYAGEATRASLEKRLVAVAIADELGVTLATVRHPDVQDRHEVHSTVGA